MMVGRSVELTVQKAPAKPGDAGARVEDLTVRTTAGLTVVDDVSPRRSTPGEIVALAGVQGNGQTELAEAITGLRDRRAAASIRLDGRGPDARRRRAGSSGPASAHIPEDRQIDGLVLSMSIADNLVLDVYDQDPHAAARGPGPRPGEARRGAQARRSSTSGPPRSRSPWARSREATSKRSWWRASCPGRSSCSWPRSPPAGSTSARSSTSTAGSSTSATRASAVLIDLLRARRGPRARRPHRRHVPGSDHGRRAADDVREQHRPDDGRHRREDAVAARRQRPDGPEAGASVQPGRERRSSRAAGAVTTAEVPRGACGQQPRRHAAAPERRPGWRRACAGWPRRTLARGHLPGRSRRPLVSAPFSSSSPPRPCSHAWGSIGSAPGHAFERHLLTPSATPTGRCSRARSSAHPPSATPSRPGRVGRTVFTPISETLVSATPLILAGTGVAHRVLRPECSTSAARASSSPARWPPLYVGFGVHPPIGIHLPLVILAGAAGGAVAGFIPGILKARTGAHEVIVTIMLNYVFLDLLDYLLTTPPLQQPGQSNSISRTVPDIGPDCPTCSGAGCGSTLGLIVALAVAAGASWFMRRSTLGFEFKVIGANPAAGRTAGMDARPGHGPRAHDLRRPGRAWPGWRLCRAPTSSSRAATAATTASTPSRWRCWAGTARLASSSARCCSRRSAPADGTCRQRPASRSTSPR